MPQELLERVLNLPPDEAIALAHAVLRERVDTPKLTRRFWSKVDKSAGPDGCWLWTAASSASGHGRFVVFGKLEVASRVAYTLAYGDPGELFVCHRCDNPPCVNPAHLYAGTPKDNAGDMRARNRHRGASITHCPRGHAYNEANTLIRTNGSRACRACARAWVSARKARVKAAARG